MSDRTKPSAKSLQALYPQDWASWAPDRRRGEVALAVAVWTAARRRETVVVKADAMMTRARAMMREADIAYDAEVARARADYQEGRDPRATRQASSLARNPMRSAPSV